MKRLVLLLICTLCITAVVQAQISFYGEWYRKGGGEKIIMIFDMEEKEAYMMNEARETCMVIEEIDKLSTNKLVGYDWEVSHSTPQRFLGMEEIDGKECAYYYIKGGSIYKNDGKDGAGYHEWVYPPIKVSDYNGCIAYDNTVYVMDRTIVLRCVKMGPQPVHLFRVSEGCQMTMVLAGGLLEMMTRKSYEENAQKVDEIRDAIQKSNEQIREQLREINDKSESDGERVKALLEILGEQKRK